MAENTLAGYKGIGLEVGRPWRASRPCWPIEQPRHPGRCGGYVAGMCQVCVGFCKKFEDSGGPGFGTQGPGAYGPGPRPGAAAWGRVPGTAVQGLGLLDPGASAARPANKVSTRQGRLASRPMRL